MTYSKVSGPPWATVQPDGLLLVSPPPGSVSSTLVVQVSTSAGTWQNSIALNVQPEQNVSQYFFVARQPELSFKLDFELELLPPKAQLDFELALDFELVDLKQVLQQELAMSFELDLVNVTIQPNYSPGS